MIDFLKKIRRSQKKAGMWLCPLFRLNWNTVDWKALKWRFVCVWVFPIFLWDAQVQLIQKMQDQFISAAWLSLLLVKMTNATGSRPYQLSLINVNSMSKLTEGQNKTWPLPGLHTLSKQLSVLCQRLFMRWCEKRSQSLCNTSERPRVDRVFLLLFLPSPLKASRQSYCRNRVLPVRQCL